MRAVLEAEGATVCEATDGFEALGAMQRVGFDAVISDLLMPRMDGYRLCQEVRANRASRDLPFIAYSSADTSPGDEKRLIALGADRVLPKPASAAVVAGVLDEVVRTRSRRAASGIRARPETSLPADQRDRAARLEDRNLELEEKLVLLAQAAAEQRQAAARWEHLLGLQGAVIAAIAGSPSLPRMRQNVLETIGCGLHWDLGEWWAVDPAAGVLRRTETWHPPTPELLEFSQATRGRALERGQGLPGRAWASGAVTWSHEIRLDADCPHGEQANRIGLRSWIGFPVRTGKEIVAVIGFFARQIKTPEAGLRELLEHLALSIGQFIAHQILARQFRLAQRLDALGLLAGGLAHDFNNILTGIVGYCALARADMPGNARLTENLDGLQAAAQRATVLVQKMLVVGRKEPEERRPVQVWPIVLEGLQLLRAAVPLMIEFCAASDPDVPAIFADATQIHQIVMNLGINAAHAMRQRGGRLTVKLENCLVDAPLAAAHPDLHPGRYARLTIRDNGHGMDAETVERIFEPFFTTKPPDEGTGLGLAVVRDIVESHEGAITVTSQCGEGTTFRIYFPAHTASANATKTDGPVPRGRSTPPRVSPPTG
jgi:signal transduction histidine kinase/DNA-binding response OmpR family regulator